MRAILDTSVVIATELPLPRDELAISAATLAELQFGVLVSKESNERADRLSRLSAVERTFEALPVDEAVAASYARLAAAVVEARRQPRRRTMDLLIAATAHAHDARLYTRNAEDLRGLDNLLEVITV